MFDRLEAIEISKSYDGLRVIDGLSFSLVRGEILGIFGPNGSGKSTTIGMLAGLVCPETGEFRADGRLVDPTSMTYRSTLGLVPQDVALYPDLTSEENLDFFARLHGLDTRTRRERIDRAFETLAMDAVRRRRVGRLSGGMRRRLNFVASLLHEPRLLLLDEPTVECDPESGEIILEMIRRLAAEGTSVVLSTHSERAQQISHRVVQLDPLLEAGVSQ